MKTTLWTKNYILLTLASAFGTIGAIAGGFALSFFVFDETGSTLASALLLAIQLVPFTVIPLLVAPIMDRLPRKKFLVRGDIFNGIVYFLLGLWLFCGEFSYFGYLVVSLILACVGSVDELAYNSIYPKVLPLGAEEKGYAVSSMLYPVLQVIMMPLAAVMLDAFGVAWILIGQGVLSWLAALTENGVSICEEAQRTEKHYGFREWTADIKEAYAYLREEKGLLSIYSYMSVTNGIGRGYGPILTAFFRTTPMMTAVMYSFFSVAEFAGRTLGSLVQYHVKILPKKKYGIVYAIYQIYECMDICLLWLPYPCMLLNRALCGFLGNNSAILRNAAIQRYIPESLRSRVNAFNGALMEGVGAVLAIAIGFLGEILDYRVCFSACGFVCLIVCWILIGGKKQAIKRVYECTESTEKI